MNNRIWFVIIIVSFINQVYSQCSSGCTTTLTATGGSGNITLDAGDTLCITATSANLEVNYAEIRMKPGSAMLLCSDPEDTIFINGQLRFFTGTGGVFSDIVNNGNAVYTFGNLTYQRANIYNHGYFEVQGNLAQNTTGPRSFTNYAGARLNVIGGIDVNAGPFKNYGTIEATGELDFNGTEFSNSGRIEIGEKITLNASSTIYIESGIFIAKDLELNTGSLETNNGCAAFLIKDNTTIFGSVSVLNGDVYITDSTDLDSWNTNTCGDVAKNCGGLVFSQTNTCFDVLPVHFGDVYVKNHGNVNVLNWHIYEESNNEKYIIQGSNDAINFTEIGKINSWGDSKEEQVYRYNLQSVQYKYARIQQVDFDGKNTNSKVVVLPPLMQTTSLVIEDGMMLINSASEILSYKLLTLDGVLQKEDEVNNNSANVDELKSGIYIVELYSEKDVFFIKMIFP